MLEIFSRRRLAGVAVCLAMWPALAGADTFRVTHSVEGSVTALAADGRAAAGLAMDTYESFRWTARDGLVRLGRGTLVPLGHMSGEPKISADGSVVSATILDAGGTYSTAGRWTTVGGWQQLAPPLPPGGGLMDGEDSSAFGLSGDGSVVTGLFWRPNASGGSAHAMAWSAADGMQDMGSSGSSSRIDGASADGRVLVGWDEHPQYGNRRAAVWVAGVLSVLEDSDWPSEASAVNGAGTVVVGYSGNPADFQTYATMWTRSGSGWTKTLLGTMNKRGSTGYAFATGVSDDGSIVVGSVRPDVMSPKSKGFLWTAQTGFVEASDYLKANGATLNPLAPITGLAAVSADGRTIAAVTTGIVAPWTVKSLIIHRQPTP